MASVFSRLRDGLARTAAQIRQRLSARADETPASTAVAGAALEVDTIESIEDVLIAADVGLPATKRILAAVRVDTAGSLRERVSREIRRVLTSAPLPATPTASPRVVLVVGVNGTGKTTSVGKLANLFKA